MLYFTFENDANKPKEPMTKHLSNKAGASFPITALLTQIPLCKSARVEPPPSGKQDTKTQCCTFNKAELKHSATLQMTKVPGTLPTIKGTKYYTSGT